MAADIYLTVGVSLTLGVYMADDVYLTLDVSGTLGVYRQPKFTGYWMSL